MQSIRRTPSRDAITVLVRGWRSVVGVMLIGGLLALGLCLLQEPVYRASTSLYVTSGTNVRPSTAYEDVMGSQNRVNSYVRLAYSDAVLSPAVKAAGLPISVAEARSAISAETAPETVILTIGASNTDPDVARRLANAVADAMIDRVAKLEVPSGGGQPTSRLTSLNPATVDPSPVSPTTVVNVVLGLLCGLLAGTVITLLRERLNGTLRDEHDAERVTGTRPLAIIPEDPAFAEGAIDFERSSGPAAAAFRHLRSAFTAVRYADATRKIVVTSPRSGDGASTVAVNLAKALSDGGDSVVLVDAALAAPVIAKRTRTRVGAGLADVVLHKKTLNDVIHQPGPDALAVIGTGRSHGHISADLLASRACGAVLDQLAKMYTYVIIDAPPLLDDSDSEALARWSDGVLLVVRPERSSLSDLDTAVTRLSDVRADLVGVVLDHHRHDSRRTRSRMPETVQAAPTDDGESTSAIGRSST